MSAPMNPRLLAVLALVLAMAAWLQWQSADEADADEASLLAPPDQRAPRTAPAGRAQGADAKEGLKAAQQTLAMYVGHTPAAASPHQPPTWLLAEPPPPPPAPRQVARVAPPPPMAPRFPHHWVGRLDDEPANGAPAVQRAVVQGPQGVWVVRPGDVIDSTWRVERIQARVMQLNYLPLDQVQTVSLR